MKKNQQNKQEQFFTIKTPKKDSSILDQFLSEFGYSAFETEERPDDSRRSVKQVSKNEELIEEVADFCRENGCSIYLIYKDNNKLMEQLFRGKQICSPKEYQSSDPTPENHTLKEEEFIQDFINKNNQKSSKPTYQKDRQNKSKRRIGVMSDAPLTKPSSNERVKHSKNQVEVTVKKKRRRLA